MSRIDFTWHTGTPPAQDVYTTRRGQSRHHTLRYWDGARWWQIEYGSKRGSERFTWPKGSRTPFPAGMRCYRDTMTLRRINDPFQAAIEWGCPMRVYDEREVLAYLINTGRLPADWREAFQAEMRAKFDIRARGAKGESNAE